MRVGSTYSCLARKSAAASTSSTSPKNPSRVPGLSFPPRRDGNIITNPDLRNALADWSLLAGPSLQQPSSMLLQSPPVIQMTAGCFLPSLGSGERYAASLPGAAWERTSRNAWGGGLAGGVFGAWG